MAVSWRAELERFAVRVAQEFALVSGRTTRANARFLAGTQFRNTRPVVVVFTGSSSAGGSGASTPALRYANRTIAQLQAAYPLANGNASPALRTLAEAAATPPSAAGLQGIQAAVAGSTAVDFLTDATATQVAALAPDLIFIHVEGNDFGNNVPPATYRATLESRIAFIKARLTRPAVFVLIHSYERMDVSGRTYPWAAYGEAQRAIALADPLNVAALDLSGAFQVNGVPGADPLDLVGVDNLHMNDAGHGLTADLIRDGLRVPLVAATATPTTPTGPTLTTLTSDAFTASDRTSMAGTSTDATLGGSSVAWQGATTSFGISGGRLVRGGSTASGALLVGNGTPNVQVECIVPVAPGAVFYLVARRSATSGGSASQYRANIQAADVMLAKTVGGTTNVNIGASIARADGDRIAIRVVDNVAPATGSTVSLYVNGVLRDSVVDSDVPNTGVFCGIGVNTGTFTVDEFKVSSVAA